jgi:hypothetical protein
MWRVGETKKPTPFLGGKMSVSHHEAIYKNYEIPISTDTSSKKFDSNSSALALSSVP